MIKDNVDKKVNIVSFTAIPPLVLYEPCEGVITINNVRRNSTKKIFHTKM